jgi:hypothetical protein
LLGLLGVGPSFAADVEVSVSVEGLQTAEPAFEITILAEPVDRAGAGIPQEALEYPAGPGPWLLELPAIRSWRLRAQAPGYWGNEVEVDPAAASSEVELRLWRSGWISGSLTTRAEAELPSQIRLRLQGEAFVSRAGDAGIVEVRCGVAPEDWQCEVPAGEFDLSLVAGRFVPRHRSRVIVEPDKVSDLRTFELSLGGSITGRVELAEGEVPSRECRIRLERPGGRYRDRQSLAEALVDEGGSFEIEGVAAGKYVLTASQPDYLAASTDTIEVAAGKSVKVAKTLLLRRPATLELVFTPPVAPEGRAWLFEVKAIVSSDDRPPKPWKGETGPDGVWTQENLEPGPYEISVTSSVGADVKPMKVELPSGWSTVPIELPIVHVEGYVVAGGEPLVASVTLTRPESELSATFKSDEAGAFSGVLPREGRWQVQVDAPAEGLSMALDPVEVWAQGGTGVAVVEIRLPDTMLEGEVTDRLGSPQGQATVSIRRPGLTAESYSFETDANGRFRIRGLEPGALSVTATAGELSSQPIDVILYESRPGSALRIVVRSRR